MPSRDLPRFLVVAAATAFVAWNAAASSPSADAMFHGGAAHTGVYAASGPAPQGRLKWRFRTAGEIVSSPAISAGTVYIGSADHQLYALDLATGALRWKFETKGRVSSSPAVVGGVVYVGSYDGSLYAVDAARGTLKWKFDTEGERRFAAPHLHGAEPRNEVMPDVFDFFLSSPVVVDGLVYFGSGDRHVYALNAADGTLRWKLATRDVVHASPAVVDGALYIGDWDSTLYALDARTGAERWRFQAGRDPDIHNQQGFQSSPAVADGLVFVGCRDAKLYAIDAKTGVQRWAHDAKGSWVIGTPAVRDGHVYASTSDTGLFMAFDERTGAPQFSIDYKHWPMFSSPALAGRYAYIGSHLGKLLAIDVTTGRQAWSFDTDAATRAGRRWIKPDGSPKGEDAYGDFFYDKMITGTYALMSAGSVLSSPAVADGVVVFGSMDGNVYALD